ncbi:AtpZ/AtpI family protein [Candidatus Parcubacteria bacterium]|nr:MAG: AtpZ/AtpI family protein [Candidatus Parcubacteria bacterium]
MQPENKNSKNKSNDWLRVGLVMFAETTGWIAFPVIGALFLGEWLDNKYDTGQLFFFSLTAGAFIVSSIGIGITGVRYMRQIELADREAKKNKENERQSDRS